MGRAWGFIPFVVMGLFHLVALAASWDTVAFVTKTLLMPALLVAFLIALPRRRSTIALWGGLALVFATLGDVLLGTPGEIGFLIGVAAFLLTHVAYIVLFLGPLRRRRIPWYALGFGVWLVVFLVIVLPHTGDLAVPVALYGVIVCAAAAASLGTAPLVTLGAVLFLVSDSILAFRLFSPGFEFWQQDVVIMVFYLAGQALMIAGTVLIAQRRQEQIEPRTAD